MGSDLKKLNKVFFDGDDNIVIQDINNSRITINRNNPKELQEFFNRFSNRITEMKAVLINQKDSYAELKDLINKHYPDARTTVMVVGTGAYDLPQTAYKASIGVGRLLADLDYNLIVGGWEGVDYVVADEYSKELQTKDIRLSDALMQVVNSGRQPIFKGGEVVNVQEGIMEWIEGLKRADILILIGGEGGTYETFLYAKQEKIPILPLPLTGGDAQRVYSEIISAPDAFPFIAKIQENFPKLLDEKYLQYLRTILMDITTRVEINDDSA